MLDTVIVAQTHERPTTQLLCPHRSDVYEQESTFDGRRLGWCDGSLGRLFGCVRTREIDCVGHTGRLTQSHDGRRVLRNRTRPTLTAYAATSTLIVRGLASSRYGSFTVSTPFLYSALTFDASTVFGSVNERTKDP